MKLEIFTKRVKHEGITIIDTTDHTFSKAAVESFRRLKEFFNFIDFGCDMKKDGTGCKKYSGDSQYNSLCCCPDCHNSVGYFRYMLDKDLKYYARVFNKKTGFWREKKGCILPKRMRSTTCLTYHCNYDQKPNFSYGMHTLSNELYNLRKKI